MRVRPYCKKEIPKGALERHLKKGECGVTEIMEEDPALLRMQARVLRQQSLFADPPCERASAALKKHV